MCPSDLGIADHQSEILRLKLQSQSWREETEKLLRQIELQYDSQCIDVGCGPTGILQEILDKIRCGGKVCGLDVNPLYLKYASTFLGKDSRLNLIQGDIRKSPLRENSFDFVHERFLLSMYKHPQQIVSQMVSITKSKGILAFQEMDINRSSLLPDHSSWRRIVEIVSCVFSKLGNNQLPYGLKKILLNAGLKNVNTREVTLSLQKGHPYAEWPMRGIASMRNEIIGLGISTKNEMDDLIGNLQIHIKNSSASFSIIQAWAYKD